MVRRVLAPAGFNPYGEAFFIDGQYVNSDVSFRRTSLTTDLVYTDTQTELNILISALRLTGINPAYVTKREQPDFEIRIVPNEVLFVEITTVIEPVEARADSKIIQFSHTLKLWYSEQPELLDRHEGLATTFFIPFPPRDRDDEELLDELKAFLSSERLSELANKPISPIAGDYPLMKTLSCKLLVWRDGPLLCRFLAGPWPLRRLASARAKW